MRPGGNPGVTSYESAHQHGVVHPDPVHPTTSTLTYDLHYGRVGQSLNAVHMSGCVRPRPSSIVGRAPSGGSFSTVTNLSEGCLSGGLDRTPRVVRCVNVLGRHHRRRLIETALTNECIQCLDATSEIRYVPVETLDLLLEAHFPLAFGNHLSHFFSALQASAYSTDFWISFSCPALRSIAAARSLLISTNPSLVCDAGTSRAVLVAHMGLMCGSVRG